ncbi:hypothetical protein BD779DRAFT_1474340 [Infundibulicybe gibba]|nr:hypothetical protein BD779DRAFT_1474340 [Infundibulicybe gibba]
MIACHVYPSRAQGPGPTDLFPNCHNGAVHQQRPIYTKQAHPICLAPRTEQPLRRIMRALLDRLAVGILLLANILTHDTRVRKPTISKSDSNGATPASLLYRPYSDYNPRSDLPRSTAWAEIFTGQAGGKPSSLPGTWLEMMRGTAIKSPTTMGLNMITMTSMNGKELLPNPANSRQVPFHDAMQAAHANQQDIYDSVFGFIYLPPIVATPPERAPLAFQASSRQY